MKYRIGVDIGGTFTDFLVLDEPGNILGFKELSSEKPEEAVYKGLDNNSIRFRMPYTGGYLFHLETTHYFTTSCQNL